jgi:hypothetical protein
MKTTKSYVPRLHLDDLERVGGDDEVRMTRFVESDVELERIENACDRARTRMRGSVGRERDRADKALSAAYVRYDERGTVLRRDWKSSGPMSLVYKSALSAYECHDAVIGHVVEDFRYGGQDQPVTFLGSDSTIARRLAEEILGLKAHEFCLYPVRASRRNQVRRLLGRRPLAEKVQSSGR